MDKRDMPRVSYIDNEDNEKSFEVEEEMVIFDALDNQDCKLPHGCLAGSCGACRIEVLEGEENLKPASAIEMNTIEAIIENHEKKHGEGSCKGKKLRLACRARVRGDVKFKSFQ
jgi:ferredoxin